MPLCCRNCKKDTIEVIDTIKVSCHMMVRCTFCKVEYKISGIKWNEHLKEEND